MSKLYKNILTKELLEKIYFEEKSLKAVGRKLGIDSSTIKRYMDQYELNWNPQVRYNCNHNFFSKDNEKSFYWAGFIAADGCIKDQKSSDVLSICLSRDDRNYLEKFKIDIEAENPIFDKIAKGSLNKKTGKKYQDTLASEIQITSNQIAEDLKRFNIVPRKSKIYTMPNWMKTHPLRHHFIRGYNDGDGSFYFSKQRNKPTPVFYFSMRGTTDFLTSVREILENDLNLEKRETPIRISSGHGTLEYGGNGVLRKIINYLYQDATIFLKRKKEIAFQIFNYSEKINYDDILNKEDVEKIYNENKSLNKTAIYFKIKPGALRNFMIRNNINIIEASQDKSKRYQSNLTPEVLRQAYQELGSINGVAKKFGIGETTAARYLKKNSII